MDVINLKNFRKQKQKLWLAKNKGRLFYFLHAYLRKNTALNYEEAFFAYQNSCLSQSEASWDYVSLREVLYDAMAGDFADQLYGDLGQEWWFNSSLFSTEEVLDQCLSIYIMDSLYTCKPNTQKQRS